MSTAVRRVAIAPRPSTVGKHSGDDVLPSLIERIAPQNLVDRNQEGRDRDSELSRQTSKQPYEAGSPDRRLHVCHRTCARRAAGLRPGSESAVQALPGISLRRGPSWSRPRLEGREPHLTVG